MKPEMEPFLVLNRTTFSKSECYSSEVSCKNCYVNHHLILQHMVKSHKTSQEMAQMSKHTIINSF